MPQTNTTWEQFKLTIDDPQILAVLEVYAEELEAEVDRLVSASKTMKKFNPNHGPDGRFVSKPQSSSENSLSRRAVEDISEWIVDLTEFGVVDDEFLEQNELEPDDDYVAPKPHELAEKIVSNSLPPKKQDGHRDFVYHATFADRILGIADNGLLPSGDERVGNPRWGGMLGDESIGRVFFTPSSRESAYYSKILVRGWIENNETIPEPVFLRVRRSDVSGLEKTPASSNELQLGGGVEPEKIEIWHHGQWKSLVPKTPVKKFNPNHDEKGRFATADSKSKVQLALFDNIPAGYKTLPPEGIYSQGALLDLENIFPVKSLKVRELRLGDDREWINDDIQEAAEEISMFGQAYRDLSPGFHSWMFLRKSLARSNGQSVPAVRPSSNNVTIGLYDEDDNLQAFVYAPIFEGYPSISAKFREFGMGAVGMHPDVPDDERCMIVDYLGTAPWNADHEEDDPRYSRGWGSRAMYVACKSFLKTDISMLALMSADHDSNEFYDAIGMKRVSEETRGPGQRWYTWDREGAEEFVDAFEKKIKSKLDIRVSKGEQQAPAEAILDAISEPNVVTTYKMRILDERLKTRSELWDSNES